MLDENGVKYFSSNKKIKTSLFPTPTLQNSNNITKKCNELVHQLLFVLSTSETQLISRNQLLMRQDYRVRDSEDSTKTGILKYQPDFATPMLRYTTNIQPT